MRVFPAYGGIPRERRIEHPTLRGALEAAWAQPGCISAGNTVRWQYGGGRRPFGLYGSNVVDFWVEGRAGSPSKAYAMMRARGRARVTRWVSKLYKIITPGERRAWFGEV